MSYKMYPLNVAMAFLLVYLNIKVYVPNGTDLVLVSDSSSSFFLPQLHWDLTYNIVLV